ncbi:insulinase family protein [Candidatus Beckwithbacteria bacterium]|nr:insulinase family protein [Candidatus Beckwithbacteria bacterium]
MNGKPQLKTLSNHLRYVIVPIPGVRSATVMALVKAGTRYETPENNGISHFLEHLPFKGTKQFPSTIKINKTIDGIGASWNAFTDKEYTAFYIKAATTHLDLSLRLVSDLVFEPLIPAKELELERKVILEEIRMYEDEPSLKVMINFEKLIFPQVPLGWDSLGSFQTIEALKRDEFFEYHDYLYVPRRMTLLIAGGVEDQQTELEAKIKTYFGTNKGDTQFKTQTYQFRQSQAKQDIFSKETEQCHLIYGFRTTARSHADRYKLLLLSTILGNGASSRLFTQIREKRGLAYYVHSMLDLYTETGYLAARAGTNPVSAQETVKVIQDEFFKLTQKPVGQAELKKAKDYLKGHLLLGFEDSHQVALFYGKDLLLDDNLRSIDEVLDSINGVTPEDILVTAQKTFIKNKQNLAAIGPIDTLTL